MDAGPDQTEDFLDYFEHSELQPPELKSICDKYSNLFAQGDVDGYVLCKNFLAEVESIGFTFEYYLDADPYHLRPIGTPAPTDD